MKCTHQETRTRQIDVVDDWTGEEYADYQAYKHDLNEHLGCGRYQCTRCGEVTYSTGSWKRFYEEGIPCPGSSLVAKYAKEPRQPKVSWGSGEGES